MLIVVTGNGKGKTTSALGQALRAVGEGRRAIMLQFIKGPWKSGEDSAWQKLAPEFEIVKGGKGFVGIQGDNLPREEHEEAAEKLWERAQNDITSGEYDLVILDELNVALSLGLVKQKEIVPTLREYKDKLDIMITGRGAPKGLINLADLVSDVKEVKHSYSKGIKAKKGIEY